MQHSSSFLLISTFLLLLTARGCHSKLMCYICDHCSSITPGMQVETCDESFFHSGGTELPSTMTTTTTEMTKDTTMTPMVVTSTPMESSTTTSTSTTTTTMTTTTEVATETTTEMIEQNTTMSTQSTQPPVPTPPTVSAPETTTALPTPPVLGTLPPMMEQMFTSTMAMAGDQMMNLTSNSSTGIRDYMNSSDFRVRQTRHVTPDNSEMLSYHCYTLQLTNNNTINTQRGCARVTTAESVCGQLKMLANNETSIKKCKYCTTNRCNASSALGISAVTVLFALVASFLKQV